MKRMLIGATTALAALAAVGGVASAQDDGDGAYTFPPNSGVEGETICVDVEGGTPTLDFEITFSGAKTNDLSYALRFVRDGNSFASPVSVPGPSSTIDFPTENGYLNDGWTDEEGLLFPGPTIVSTSGDGVFVIAEITDEGDGDALYTSGASAVELDNNTCVASQVPPTTTTTTTTTPATTSPTTSVAQQPPPAGSLPATGMSTFDSSMRAGALLLIAGLGFVIVARRRRFASTTAGN